MKTKVVCLISSLFFSIVVWGQTASQSEEVSSSLRLPSSTPEVSSSIDLLKKSLHSSSQTVVGVASSTSRAKRANKQPAAETSQSDSTPAQTDQNTSKPDTAASSTAVPTQSGASTAAAAVSVPTGASTLDMPLEIGGTAQSVQTSVKPVKATKPLSPAVANRVAKSKQQREKKAEQSAPTEIEKAIETENTLLPPSSKAEPTEAPTPTAEEEAADAELEYAVKMLEESKEKANSTGRRILPSASQNRPSKVPAPNKAFNPSAYRPGVTWLPSKSTHFDIYTQKRTEGIPSANMPMTFESAYQTLSRFIPWMMSGRVRVFVYQDRASYLRHEPNAIAWSRAVAYPTRGEVVVYDEPGKNQELKESFTHELTHIFTQQFFDSHKTGQLMTPLWLDEGLAVMMEDQAYNGAKGGPWANDLKTINFQRNPASTVGIGVPSSSMFGSSNLMKKNSKKRGKTIVFDTFEDFMQDNSLQVADSKGKAQDWYLQAYAMVRFLFNPSGSSSPSNRMQFEQFTRLLSQGEPKRNPSTGFTVKDKNGKTIYEPYSVEKALGKAYRYNNIASFEDGFWRWANNQ